MWKYLCTMSARFFASNEGKLAEYEGTTEDLYAALDVNNCKILNHIRYFSILIFTSNFSAALAVNFSLGFTAAKSIGSTGFTLLDCIITIKIDLVLSMDFDLKMIFSYRNFICFSAKLLHSSFHIRAMSF